MFKPAQMFVISFEIDGKETKSTAYSSWYDANSLKNELIGANKFLAEVKGKIKNIKLYIDDSAIVDPDLEEKDE